MGIQSGLHEGDPKKGKGNIMSQGKRQELTKEYLESIGFIDVKFEDGGWKVIRRWKTRCNSAQTSVIRPYSNGGTTFTLALSVEGKTKTVSFPRVVYAWFVGTVPADCEVVQKDGNRFNADPSNLRLLQHFKARK